MQKRTYSTSHKKREEMRRKRLKSNEDSDLHQPGDTPRLRPPQSSSLLKSFRGPVSFDLDSNDDMSGSAPTESTPLLPLFDRALNGKRKPVNPQKKYNIHGSQEDFDDTMNAKSTESTARDSLPTPLIGIQRQQGQRMRKFLPDLKEAATILVTNLNEVAWKRKETDTVEKMIEPEKLERPYVPKQYASQTSCAPRKDLCGNRLSTKSKEVELWNCNQSNSLFLQLPGEVRNRIYEYALGGYTINIGYETYRCNMTLNEVSPVFRYHCVVYNQFLNPFKITQQQDVEFRTHYTMLNNVCRQLNLETSTLPFSLNRIAFDSYHLMFNFVVQEQRLSRQQRHALVRLLLRDDLPGANILGYLPNLKKVFLHQGSPTFVPSKGWYNVVRAAGQEPKLRLVKRY